MKISRFLAAATALLAALALAPASWAAPKKHSGTITTTVDLSAYDPAGEAELWLPYPVSDRDQKITDVTVKGDFVASAVYADAAFSTPMLYARWNKGATSRKLTFSFKAERSEVVRRDFPAVEGTWNRADFAQYLAATSLGPLDGEVGKLATTITAGKTTVLEKAKAIYDWTCENTYRDPKTRGCGAGDVCALLKQPGGKCADIHSVFVALARAAGVPAREAFGIRMGKKDVEDVSTWQHCWAEFYLPGYGWVPVDPADVRKAMLVENLKLEDAKTREYRTYFWGAIDPYRVKLSAGRDLILNPPQPGGPVNYLMYPFARVGDKIIDSLDPATFKYSIIYTAR
ncbi:transglutaminase domain-containing protein [Oryzomonas sagensis]|uniref:Transglutaminase domain-containing protein n=1 Tax=Oryzomonas sagensis TaxID=2603857 RepID=A0ABQ6TSE7_9BACT|nr:transglutaminase domain-containing protein [Oryzomonas sagensis]KAB0671966.1 transglutaminase domain-containing protein [Oryzomonas sagensis]